MKKRLQNDNICERQDNIFVEKMQWRWYNKMGKFWKQILFWGEIYLKKKIVIILLIVFVAIIGFEINRISTIDYVNPVMASLPKYDNSDCYYSDGFQDYTDYCKYYFSDDIVEKIENNRYFKCVTNDDVAELNRYFDDFENSLEWVEYKDEYDFQRSYIDTEDYFYIENNETGKKYAGYSGKYQAYDLYFFDVQSKTLFFIHNNI